MDHITSLELEQRMMNFKKVHLKEQRCVEVDVESELNDSLRKLPADFEV